MGSLPDALQPGRVASKHETEAKKAKHKQTPNSPASVNWYITLSSLVKP